MSEGSFPRHRLARPWLPRHIRNIHLPRLAASLAYLTRYYILGHSEPARGRHHRVESKPIRQFVTAEATS